jgi:hypothetical protein
MIGLMRPLSANIHSPHDSATAEPRACLHIHCTPVKCPRTNIAWSTRDWQTIKDTLLIAAPDQNILQLLESLLSSHRPGSSIVTVVALRTPLDFPIVPSSLRRIYTAFLRGCVWQMTRFLPA